MHGAVQVSSQKRVHRSKGRVKRKAPQGGKRRGVLKVMSGAGCQ